MRRLWRRADPMRRVFSLLSVLCIVLLPAGAAHAADADALHKALAAEQTRPQANPYPRRDFLLQPSVAAVILSPDGRHVAWLRKDAAGQVGLWLMDADSRKARRLLRRTDARRVHFSHDGHWLLLESARSLFAVALDGAQQSRLVSTLGGREQRRLIAVDPTRPAAVLMVEHDIRGSGHWQLLRVTVSGKRKLLYQDAHEISGFALAGKGHLAWVQRVEGDALVSGRLDGEGRFQPVLRCGDLHVCRLLPVTDGAGAAWMISNADADLAGLVLLHADASTTPVQRDPRGEADIDEVEPDPVTGQPRIASYRSTVAANYALDAATEGRLKRIARQFPGRDIRISLGRGPQARWLLAERGDVLQGTRWHLYDPRTGTFETILDFAPLSARKGRAAQWLPPVALARKIPVSWQASDGMRLYGYVSVPPGRSAAKLPLVALIHGGPWNAVGPNFDGGAQFLANRGYAVFEPNFRASTGHGHRYMMSAHGDFGGSGRVQRDIVEGVRYVLQHGVGDPRRVGIVGASFGGYASLAGVSFDADLFKVGVAAVPPSDFSRVLAWFARGALADSMSRFIPFTDMLRSLDLDLADDKAMARLHADSPMAHVAQMNRPLVIMASGRDRRVPIGGVIEYAARLKLAHKNVSLYVDPDADHATRGAERREAWFYLIAQSLHQSLGGSAPQPPDAVLRAYLDRTRRIAAPAAPAAGS